jgi:hypothetical protein
MRTEMVVDVGRQIGCLLQQFEQDAVAALVAFLIVVQQRQAHLAVGQEVLLAVLEDDFIETGEHLFADGVEVAQFEVAVDIKNPVHDLEQGARPHAQHVAVAGALRGVHQQLHRVFGEPDFGWDQVGLAGFEEVRRDEIDGFAMAAQDAGAGRTLVEIEAVFARELARVMQIAQCQRRQVNGRHAARDGIQVAPVQREPVPAFERRDGIGHGLQRAGRRFIWPTGRSS